MAHRNQKNLLYTTFRLLFCTQQKIPAIIQLYTIFSFHIPQKTKRYFLKRNDKEDERMTIGLRMPFVFSTFAACTIHMSFTI